MKLGKEREDTTYFYYLISPLISVTSQSQTQTPKNENKPRIRERC